jgi:hypothetical protein
VTEIDLGGAGPITIYQGEQIDLSGMGVWSYSLIESRKLNDDEYTVDFGGLDVNNPAVGTYTVTYTYKEDGELTDITATLIVNVIKREYAVHAMVESGDGYIEYEGNRNRDVFVYAEEDSRIILKAGVYAPTRCAFLRWETYNYHEDVWELYSTDSSISVVVDSDIKIRAIFGGIVEGLRIQPNTNISSLGVEDYHFEQNGYWDEELGKYVSHGHIILRTDSECANDITLLFKHMNYVAIETNGRHTVIEAEDLAITLGEDASHDWYTLVISYGTYMMQIDVTIC